MKLTDKIKTEEIVKWLKENKEIIEATKIITNREKLRLLRTILIETILNKNKGSYLLKMEESIILKEIEIPITKKQ